MNSYTSLCFDASLSPQSSAALLGAARESGLRAQFMTSKRFARTDVLLAAPGGASVVGFTARYPHARVYDPPIIALAIEPQTDDALPELLAALCGDGAPSGAVRAELRDGAVVLEFCPAVTPWKLLHELIDVELRRFGSSARRITLLSPLTIEMEAQVARDGLECGGLDSSRVLEPLVDRAGS
ncbi:MAG: hypothetical protein NVS1B14_04440 [Vulcanimicrobiaceae bacterium]